MNTELIERAYRFLSNIAASEYCPACYQAMNDGHAADCELLDLMSDLGAILEESVLQWHETPIGYCDSCGRLRPVRQTDIADKPVCRQCDANIRENFPSDPAPVILKGPEVQRIHLDVGGFGIEIDRAGEVKASEAD